MCWFVRCRLYMKFISVFIIILLGSACTLQKVKTVELSPDALRQKIISGDIFKTGDTVNIITSDGEKHSLVVLDITEDRVVGKQNSPGDNSGKDKDAPLEKSDFEDDQGAYVEPDHTSEPGVEKVEIPISDIVTVELIQPTVMAYTLAGSAVGGLLFIQYFLLPTIIVTAMAGL